MKKGFTLIELLVVVSIISFLSSIVFSALQLAREQAAVSAIKAETRQLFTLIQQEYYRVGDYNLFTDLGAWMTSTSACNNFFNGTSEQLDNMRDICESIRTRLPSDSTSLLLHCNNTGSYNTCGDRSEKFSITVKLNDNLSDGDSDWFCMGSSGGVYEGIQNSYRGFGCYYNP